MRHLQAGADPAAFSPRGESALALCRLADPAEGALPEDPAMTALVEQALLPWHPTRHRLFPRQFGERMIMPLLLVQLRMERRHVQPPLTARLWLNSVVPFLRRFWFEPRGDASVRHATRDSI